MSSETIKHRAEQQSEMGGKEEGQCTLDRVITMWTRRSWHCGRRVVAVVLNRFGIALLIEQLSELKACLGQSPTS